MIARRNSFNDTILICKRHLSSEIFMLRFIIEMMNLIVIDFKGTKFRAGEVRRLFRVKNNSNVKKLKMKKSCYSFYPSIRNFFSKYHIYIHFKFFFFSLKSDCTYKAFLAQNEKLTQHGIFDRMGRRNEKLKIETKTQF